MSCGVVIGADHAQEWLLPWWWRCYSQHNSYPICFIDFGISEAARRWVQKRGWLFFPLVHSISLNPVMSLDAASWGCISVRKKWFQKPLACLQSPWSLSCWLDIDCEIRSNISPLFNSLSLGNDLALAKDVVEHLRPYTILLPPEIIYNSGVISFRRNAPILHLWKCVCVDNNQHFLSDQDALSWLIEREQPPFIELPMIYNWHAGMNPGANAVIVHYAGNYKDKLQKEPLTL